MKKGVLYWILGSVIFVLILSGILLFFYLPSLNHSTMDMEEKRDHFVSLKNNMQLELVEDREYKCCLMKPCTYCIEKTPGHGEGASCNCLKDIVEGVHPCGECIGEILEGHGNPNLAKYFANAIAEKVGEEHIQTFKEIIEEKYDVPIDEQYDY
ncbi:MAG: hypothetical protein V3R31_06355 [Candidatus Humimicrobiaceae bacterium]